MNILVVAVHPDDEVLGVWRSRHHIVVARSPNISSKEI
ncbi:hypothetical protein APA_944 [Pseudanabaena sp. lw0831]|nr:hypothetical protein APA_944 [Pseudanabaena sp. lw0831]